VAAPLPEDRRQGTCLLERRTASASWRDDHAVAELGELEKLAAVERQLLDAAVVDDVADFGIRGLQQRHGGGDMTFSLRAPSGSVIGRSTRWPTCRITPGRVTVLNPSSVTVTEYSPTGSPGTKNRPASSDTRSILRPFVALSTTMDAPGSSPPVESLMTP
jgi:hypothetical protein